MILYKLNKTFILISIIFLLFHALNSSKILTSAIHTQNDNIPSIQSQNHTSNNIINNDITVTVTQTITQNQTIGEITKTETTISTDIVYGDYCGTTITKTEKSNFPILALFLFLGLITLTTRKKLSIGKI